MIPIYRALKLGTKNEYVEGWLIENIIYPKSFRMFRDGVEIDTSTLAIHFPDMLASDSDRLLPNGEKDLRIFASLSEDGKGGDIIGYIFFRGKEELIFNDKAKFNSYFGLNPFHLKEERRKPSIIGIQE